MHISLPLQASLPWCSGTFFTFSLCWVFRLSTPLECFFGEMIQVVNVPENAVRCKQRKLSVEFNRRPAAPVIDRFTGLPEEKMSVWGETEDEIHFMFHPHYVMIEVPVFFIKMPFVPDKLFWMNDFKKLRLRFRQRSNVCFFVRTLTRSNVHFQQMFHRCSSVYYHTPTNTPASKFALLN